MNYTEFLDSLTTDDCPVNAGGHLQALWYDACGDWDTAHNIVQPMHDPMAARIHAYLHRKEGDDWNSRYWHRVAGSDFPVDMSLEDEWVLLVRENTEMPA